MSQHSNTKVHDAEGAATPTHGPSGEGDEPMPAHLQKQLPTVLAQWRARRTE
ncbi:hypothetical protein [Streptomyces coeruleorubidus]|uniref:hypothetical protein n=1 Tax=Streptomyces coeruleorubidus TaxID=116188 RepID=UPI0037A13C68